MHRPCRALLMILMLCSLLWTGAAQAVTVDYQQTGEIQIQLEAPAGYLDVEIALYHIGHVGNADGGLQYSYLEAFRGCDASLVYETASEAEAAARIIDQYIDLHGIQPIRKMTTDADGRTTFARLQAGVYFGRKSGGNSQVDMIPFIVTVPYYQDRELLYQVPVNPKIEVRPTPPPTVTPIPDWIDEEKLPQTGILRWPAAVLSMLGCALLLTGLFLIRHDKERRRKM